jgi:predicted Zn-dependent peptidase
MKPKLKHLKNGIPVLLIPQKGAESMTLSILVKVGSRYETKDINGASHFIEHMMFKGTKRRPDSQIISRTFDRYGAEFNAYTSKDFTCYYVKMDAEQTPLAIDLLHDMLFHSTYDPVEFDKERNVILEEINMYEDNPQRHIDDLLDETLFQGSTLGWNIAGPRKVIQTVPRAKLIAYRDAYYIPERLTIALSGKIHKKAWKLLTETFGQVKKPTVRKDKRFETFHRTTRHKMPIAIQNKQTEQVQLGMAFYGLPIGHKNLAAATLLGTILGGSMSSRLFVEMRERKGLCYTVSASHQALEDTGMFSIMAGLDKKRFADAVKTLITELKRTTHEFVTPEELRRAKDHVRGRLTLALEDSSFQADWYGKQWMFRGKIEAPEKRLKRFEKVTARDIRRVAQMLFRKEHLASAVIGPFGSRAALAKMIKWT